MNKFGLILTQLALLLSYVGLSQSNPFYADLFLEPTGEIVDKKGAYDVYILGNLTLYNGTGKNERTFYVEVANSGVEIFRFEDESIKDTRFDPKFFKANDELPVVIMMDVETSFSWGQHIFIIDGKEITHSGFLPFGADNFNFSNLGLYAQFNYQADYFDLTLRDGVKYIDYVTDDLIDASELKFKVEKNKITRLY